MSKVACYKIKDGKITKIQASICNSQKKIDSLLDKGFTVTKSIKTKTEYGEEEKIVSFSPMTRVEAWERHKKKMGPGIPF